MRFHVVDPLTPQSQTASVESKCFPDAPGVRTVMWIPFSRHHDPKKLDSFISHNCPLHVLRSDVAIIGLHPSTARFIRKTNDILDDVATRIENIPLYVVYHSNDEHRKPVIEHVRGKEVAGIDSRSALDIICHQDITQVVRRPGTELPMHSGHHYQGPNGEHYRAFLRPGFAARSIEELDRLSFWMAPSLLGKNRFLVDHSSMISIAYHLGQYAVELGDEKSVIVQSLRSYDEPLDALVRRLKRTFGRIIADSGAIIMSVNSSGRLAQNRLLPAMTKVGFCDPPCIAIASTPNPPIFPVKSLITLEKTFERKTPLDCNACKEGSTLIQIQEDSYLLNLAAHVHFNRITRSDASPARDVVNRYRGIGAFRIHVTYSTGRHHAFYVDLIPMLESDRFKQRLAQCLHQLQHRSIDLIIHPSHNAAQRLARMVAERLGIDDIVKSDEDLRNLSAEDVAKILSAKSVCLVDDAVVTGARLFGYRSRLDEFCREHNRDGYDLYSVVGISRPENARAIQGIGDIVGHSSNDQRFLSVEQLFLPYWDETECPWCKELEILESLREDSRMQRVVRERIDILEARGGISEDLFVPWPSSDERKRARYWRLGENSIFGEVQGADLVISVASTIQSLRSSHLRGDSSWSETKLDEVFRSPIAKVLDPEFYLGRRFYEPVLIASIFRSIKAHDVLPPSHEGLLLRRLEFLLKNDRYRHLHGEIALSIARKHIPITCRRLLAECYRSWM